MPRSARTLWSTVAVAALTLGGLTLVATPAQATSPAPALPEGSHMFVVGCDAENTTNVWEYDPVTGAAVLIGSPSTHLDRGYYMNCGPRGTYNRVTGQTVFVAWAWDNWFVDLNMSTGESTPLSANAGPNLCGITSDAEGTFWQLTRANPYVLQSIDPNTGESTDHGTVGQYGYQCVIDVNPVNNELTTFEKDGSNWYVSTISKTDASFTRGVQVDLSAVTGVSRFCPNSVAIDSNGIAWVEDDCYAPHNGIVAIDTQTGEAWPMAAGAQDVNHSLYPTASQISGSRNAEGWFYQMSMWFVPAPVVTPTPTPTPTPSDSGAAASPAAAALAATGADGSALGATALVLGAGATLAFAIRRRQRA